MEVVRNTFNIKRTVIDVGRSIIDQALTEFVAEKARIKDAVIEKITFNIDIDGKVTGAELVWEEPIVEKTS
jgi:hypothetical protein